MNALYFRNCISRACISPGRPFPFIYMYINLYVYACMCAFAGEQYIDPIPNNSWCPFTELPTRKQGLKLMGDNRLSSMNTSYDDKSSKERVEKVEAMLPFPVGNHDPNGGGLMTWLKLAMHSEIVLWNWRNPFIVWVFVELFLNGYAASFFNLQ